MGPGIAVRRTPIERASPADMMELASDIGPAPRQVGALLRFGPGTALGFDDVRRSIADRIGGIRRLRQQLVPTPWGCGRPVWVDDLDFDIAHHVEAVASRAPGDDTALLATAAALVTRPLPAHRPLWSATLVEGLADGGCALVVIFHHILADGMGGLAVLASLVDGGLSNPSIEPPAPPPRRSALAYDAACSRLRALAHVHRVPGTIRAALAELRSGSAPHAARCSINRPVGARRRFATATADLKEIRAVAHAHGASVNDVMLATMGGALDELLAHRGEHVDPFVISVPVSGRTQASAGALGNQVGVMPVAVPASGETRTRLEAIAADTRARKARIRGASAALLVPAFRVFGALHALRWGVNHQHLVHTFATNLRGPDSPVSFLGATVSDIVPLNVLAGNVAVAFAVMSYSGSVTLTLTVDPDVIPDLDVLVDGLRHELDPIGPVRAFDDQHGTARTGGSDSQVSG
jgi:diacylglycerol O-acyltransferase